MCVPRWLARVYIVCTCVPLCSYVGTCLDGFPSGSPSRLLGLFLRKSSSTKSSTTSSMARKTSRSSRKCRAFMRSTAQGQDHPGPRLDWAEDLSRRSQRPRLRPRTPWCSLSWGARQDAVGREAHLLVWEEMSGGLRRPEAPRLLVRVPRGSDELSRRPCQQRLALEALRVSFWLTQRAQQVEPPAGEAQHCTHNGAGQEGTQPSGQQSRVELRAAQRDWQAAAGHYQPYSRMAVWPPWPH